MSVLICIFVRQCVFAWLYDSAHECFMKNKSRYTYNVQEIKTAEQRAFIQGKQQWRPGDSRSDFKRKRGVPPNVMSTLGHLGKERKIEWVECWPYCQAPKKGNISMWRLEGNHNPLHHEHTLQQNITNSFEPYSWIKLRSYFHRKTNVLAMPARECSSALKCHRFWKDILLTFSYVDWTTLFISPVCISFL